MVKDVNSEIVNSTFTANQALKGDGGAIYFSCSLANTKGCSSEVRGNNFSGNWANAKGGAIYFDLFSPKGLKTGLNIYQDNNASYGPNYGSYPFRLA
jgi:predicted outer membrane repeat protein